MVETHLHAAPEPLSTPRRNPGPLTEGLMKWNAGDGTTPWAGISGPDAASIILLRAHALTSCFSAAFSERGSESEFSLLPDGQKALAWDGIGDLILLAKVLVDEA